MIAQELIVLNFQEVRRRSLLVWRAISDDLLNWRPDNSAMSLGEMVRHTWESIIYYFAVLKQGGSITNFQSGFENIPINSIEGEIKMSKGSFDEFLAWAKSISADNLHQKIIDRSDVGYKRTLGDMLLRIAYHESVHTGQLLQCLRLANIDRPKIWD